jgi:HAD superfamily hydrolase (TIGR01484 family)
MRFVILASDYDGTLAHDGLVHPVDAAPQTLDALARLRQSGRKTMLVTGRELPDLERVFPHLERFDMGVDEDTWMFHLRRHHYSGWFRDSIGDEEIANEIEAVENEPGISRENSLKRIVDAIERKYTAPA